jgi:hypothetical protein
MTSVFPRMAHIIDTAELHSFLQERLAETGRA